MTIRVTSNEKPETPPEAKAESGAEKVSDESQAALDSKESEQNEEASESEPDATEENEVGSEGGESPRGESDAKDGKPGKKGGFQRRIDKLNQRVSAREQELEYWKAQALKTSAPEKTESKVEPMRQAEGKPNPDSFNTHAEYVEALTDWKTDQKLNERDQKREQSKQLAERDRVAKEYVEKSKVLSAKHEDYDEVISEVDDIPISPAVRELLLSAENGPAIAYELAKNREEYARVCKLPPLAAAREIGKIESRIDALSSGGKATGTKKLTDAPKPLEPVGSGKGSVKKSIFDPSLSQSEYEKLRKAEINKRKQA